MEKILNWRISTAEALRRRFVQAINEYRRDPDPDIPRFRALMYGMRGVQDALRLEKDCEVEKRLTALEARFKELKNEG